MDLDLPTLASNLTLALALVIGARFLYLIAKRFLEDSLDIAVFEGGDSGAGLNMFVRSELQHFKEEGGGNGLSFVFAPDQEISLPENITAVAPALGPIAAVAAYLPGRVKTLQTTLHADGARGLGVTTSLVKSGGRVIGTTTIWEREFVPVTATTEDAERYQRLALAVAAWTAYQIIPANLIGVRAALLSQDWESYAIFAIAARLQQTGQIAAAREGYAKALDRDPRNRGALFNLASLEIAEEANDAAINRLTAVISEMDLLPEPTHRERDRLWYRARYNRAVACWHKLNVPNRAGAAPWLTDATSDLRTVITRADEWIRTMGGDEKALLGGANADFVRFLSTVRAAAVVAYAEVTQP